VQNDIKRVIAYSTCSQLGYMFVAAGVGVYSVAMFHLFTHAFFKAMLFLGAGSVIHAMHHEQDMRNYGGLRKKIPYTFWAMMIGTLAITGVGIPRPISASPASSRRMRCRRKRLCLRRGPGDVRLLGADHRGGLHQLLLVAADVPDLLRRGAGQQAHARPRP
jgi:hypothetical protein